MSDIIDFCSKTMQSKYVIEISIFYLFQIHRTTESDKQIKSKSKQNLELSAKNRELTQSLKQLHQNYQSSSQLSQVRSQF